MNGPLRVVLDTNVFVSALLKADGKTARLLLLWRKAKIRLIFTEETIAETLRVLRELDISRPQRQRIDSLIRRPLKRRSILVKPQERFTIIEDDADNRFLEAAVTGKAQYLVTNNRKHFQDAGVRSFRGVQVISISEFLKIAGIITEL